MQEVVVGPRSSSTFCLGCHDLPILLFHAIQGSLQSCVTRGTRPTSVRNKTVPHRLAHGKICCDHSETEVPLFQKTVTVSRWHQSISRVIFRIQLQVELRDLKQELGTKMASPGRRATALHL